jgi:ADP-heptose:LPS heptosyltransferase
MLEIDKIIPYIHNCQNTDNLRKILSETAIKLSQIYGQQDDKSLEEKLLLISNFIIPNQVNTFTRLANFYHEKDDVNKALLFAEKALEVTKYKNVQVLLNAAIMHAEYGNPENAKKYYKTCLKLDKNCHKAFFGLSMEQFKENKIRKAWEFYYSRHSAFDMESKVNKKILKLPLWDGKQKGKVIFYNEQGYGDFLFSMRYFHHLNTIDNEYKFFMDENMAKLVKSTKYSQRVTTTVTKSDYRCSYLDIPYLFKIRKHEQTAYKNIFIQHNKKIDKKPKIAVVFSGNKSYVGDKQRSIKTSELDSILSDDRYEFYFLQKDLTENSFYDKKYKIKNLDKGLKNYLDTLNALYSMDGLLTVDTSVAHLGAAIGLPTFILLNSNPDFRWHGDEKTTPWYSSWIIFKQSTRGNWNDVISNCQKYMNEYFLNN